MVEKPQQIAMKRIIEFFKGVREEIKKITWPTRKQTMRDTLIVIGASAGVAIFLGACDLLFTFIIEKVIKK